MAVVHDLIQVLQNLNGVGTLTEIYDRYRAINSDYFESTVRRTLQQYSSDTESYLDKGDYFFSVNGLGNGVWGLRNYFIHNDDNGDPNDNNPNNVVNVEGNLNPKRTLHLSQRIVRDTVLARQIKNLVGNKCQLCDVVITLPNGQLYCEAHHIKPLCNPYNGPDVKENILIVCPNCHVECDYRIILLNIGDIRNNLQMVGEEYIRFHNEQYEINITV